ncbi:DMT family transporter [Henriciella aquimarina]|uniref:DMT family transporter n=1 Tax=Henriciella aquimarina TaxID=545261 RepID=UPI000A076510|nr:DMT family transporter [Henriciella aquimarina]
MTTHRSPAEWGLFLLLSLCWACAFAMTKLAVGGLPASVIIPGRLTVAALILWGVMLARGERLPPFSDRAAWLSIVGLGTIGTAAPFYLITLGQKTIDSSLAALLISAAPLFTAVLAHIRFHDEQITAYKAAGLIVGFAGVAVLLGPDALTGLDLELGAQLLVLMGAFCYAINSIIARQAPRLPAIVMPVGFLTVASIASLPMLVWTDWSEVQPTAVNLAAVLGLGAISTAAAGIILMYLVARTSATFIALTGYVIPIMSAVIGYFAFRETQSWNALVAFVLILAGVWFSQRQARKRAPA